MKKKFLIGLLSLAFAASLSIGVGATLTASAENCEGAHRFHGETGVCVAEGCGAIAFGAVPSGTLAFPDIRMREKLATALGTLDDDGVLTKAELDSVTTLDLTNTGGYYKQIKSLEGIEHFTELKELTISDNGFTEVDLSNNVKLEKLTARSCSYLESLNISACTELKQLEVRSSSMEALDFSNNKKLEEITLGNLMAKSFDFSEHEFLKKITVDNTWAEEITFREGAEYTWLFLPSNRWKKLDLSGINADSLSFFRASGRFSLEINADRSIDFSRLGEYFDPTLATFDSTKVQKFGDTYYALEGAGESYFAIEYPTGIDGKTMTYDIVHLFDKETHLCECGNGLLVHEDIFPDPALRGYLSTRNGSDYGDGYMPTSIYSFGCTGLGIKSLKGIEYIAENIRTFHCENNEITDLSVVKLMPKVTDIICYNNQITEIDTSNNPELIYFHCENNNITSLDVSTNTKLKVLYCYDNPITDIDLSANTVMSSFNKHKDDDGSYGKGIVNIGFAEGEALEIDMSEYVSDISKVSIVSGGTLSGNTVTVDEGATAVEYKYTTGNATIDGKESLLVVLNVHTHAYDNACDTACNVCEEARTVEPHVYDNACDTACNVCNAAREITHDYQEGKCSVCGATDPNYVAPPAAAPASAEEDDEGGLGVGAIVAICVGGAAVVGVGSFALVWFVIKKKTWADFIAIFKKAK